MPGESEKADSSFAQVLNQQFAKYYNEQHPLSLLLLAYGAHEGGEDLSHLVDFYQSYQKLLREEKNIQLHCLVFISSDKLAQFKKRYEDDLPESLYEYQEGDAVDKEKLNRSHFVIWTGYRGDPAYQQEHEVIQTYLGKQAAIINLAHPIASQTVIVEVINHAPVGTFVQSCSEYGASGIIYTYDGRIRKIYDEISMGIDEKEIGIEVKDELEKNTLMDDTEKAALFNSLKNKNLLSELLKEDKEAEVYLKSHSLAYSGLHSKTGTENFILTAAAISSSDKVDLFIYNHFFKVHEDYSLSEKVIEHLKRLAVLKIELLNNNGELIKAISIKVGEEEDLVPRKILRLIDHSGMAEHDRMALLSLSTCLTASGDASISEAISAKKFPFFYLHDWKAKFCEVLIKQLKNVRPRPEELIQYLTMATQKPREGFKEASYARANQSNILAQWQSCCEQLLARQKARSPKLDFIEKIKLAAVFKKGDEEDLREILKLKPEWMSGDSNFVFLAVMGRNLAALKLMFEADQRLFYKMINDLHPSIRISPFLFVVMNQDEEMTRAFLAYSRLNVKLVDPQGFDAIHMAIRNNDVKLLQFFLTTQSDPKSSDFVLGPAALLNTQINISWLETAIHYDAHDVLTFLLPLFHAKPQEIQSIFQHALSESKLDSIDAMLPELKDFPVTASLKELYLNLIDNGFCFIENKNEQFKPLADFIFDQQEAATFVKATYQAAFKRAGTGFGLVDYFMSGSAVNEVEAGLLTKLAVLALLACKSKDLTVFTNNSFYQEAAGSKNAQIKTFLARIEAHIKENFTVGATGGHPD